MEVLILAPDGTLHPAEQAAHGSHHAIARVPCPACGIEQLRVEGLVPHVVMATDHEHKTEWEARAICCGKDGFTIGVRRVSLFGFEEDRRVLEGRPRVY